MILVVGATGFVGGEVCTQLAAAGKRVRALVRTGGDFGKKQRLASAGIELVDGDIKDRTSLNRVCQGVHTIISTASATISHGPGDDINTVDLKGQMNVIDAAYSAGASHFIYVSFSGKIDSDFPLRNAKRTVEDYLKGSGLTFTILRPTFFMEIWLGPAVGFDYPNGKVRIYGEGKSPISWISFADVARFAALAVDHPAAANSVIELGGPEALSPIDVVRIFEEASGRKFETTFVPEEALVAQKAAATDPLHETLSALMIAYAHGDIIDMRPVLQHYPIRLTRVSEYAQRAAIRIQ